jgi:hypothetical protein
MVLEAGHTSILWECWGVAAGVRAHAGTQAGGIGYQDMTITSVTPASLSLTHLSILSGTRGLLLG